LTAKKSGSDDVSRASTVRSTAHGSTTVTVVVSPQVTAEADPLPSPVSAKRQEASQRAKFGTTSKPKPRRRLGGFLALIGSAILLLIALIRLLPTTTAESPASAPSHGPQPSPPAPPRLVVGAAAVAPALALGAKSGLLGPQEAIELAGGHIAVADTGNKRLVILDAAGRLLRRVTAGAGPLQQPYALAATKRDIYLLDAKGGAIEQYDLRGRFERELARGPSLSDAKGLALGRDGNLYVANPRTNSVLVLSAHGTTVREFASPLGSASDQLNQPSDVAIGNNGTVYVVDNVNYRIKAITPHGAFIRSWAVPGSSTLYSVHVLSIPDGRVLASDPAGSLLLYPNRGRSPRRILLAIRGQPAAGVSPLGLALMGRGKILVTDHAGNRLLVVTLPPKL
jgi:streptogramin lyase